MKRMTKQMQEDLKEAGNFSAEADSDYLRYICNAMYSIKKNRSAWMRTEEAKMLKPDTYGWWNPVLENEARLIGIAMMVTMPIEIIEHKCAKK